MLPLLGVLVALFVWYVARPDATLLENVICAPKPPGGQLRVGASELRHGEFGGGSPFRSPG